MHHGEKGTGCLEKSLVKLLWENYLIQHGQWAQSFLSHKGFDTGSSQVVSWNFWQLVGQVGAVASSNLLQSQAIHVLQMPGW